MPSSDPRNYARFIPKEEQGVVSHWRFGAVGSDYSPDQLDARKLEAEENRQLLLLAEQDAYARGLAEGRAQAQEEAERLCHAFIEQQGRAAAQHTADQLAAVVTAAQAGLAQADERIAQGLLELACTIARQVLRHELSVDPGAVRHVVAEALGLLTTDGRVATIRLNAQDLALLQEPLTQAFAGQALVFVADAALLPGDCRVESAGAVVDSSLEKRWTRAVSSLGVAGFEVAGLQQEEAPDAS